MISLILYTIYIINLVQMIPTTSKMSALPYLIYIDVVILLLEFIYKQYFYRYSFTITSLLFRLLWILYKGERVLGVECFLIKKISYLY